MKKYLLLASVAGCLLNAGNAMADTGQSAVVNVSVDIQHGCTIESFDSISFGEVLLDPDKETTTIHMDSDGDLTSSDALYVNKADGVSRGVISIICGSNVPFNIDVQEESLTSMELSNISYLLGTETFNIDGTHNGSDFYDGQSYKNIYIFGDLEIQNQYVTEGNHSEPALTFTLQY